MEEKVKIHFENREIDERINIIVFNPNTQTEIRIFGADKKQESRFNDERYNYDKVFNGRGAESGIETYLTGVFSGNEDLFDKIEYNVTKIKELNQDIARSALLRSKEFRIFSFDENPRKTFIFKKVIQNEKFDEFSTDRISSATEEFDNNNFISIEFNSNGSGYKIDTNVMEQEKKRYEVSILTSIEEIKNLLNLRFLTFWSKKEYDFL